MKKLMLLAALLAMVAVAAIPAIAQVTQEEEQEGESGELNQDFSVTSEGDNSNQCAGIQGVANTGNAQNLIDLTQVDGEADDFEFDEVDSSVEVSPESSTTCDQQVNQAASATG
jgi:maltose-binding protein MalE